MDVHDPFATQRDPGGGVVEELAEAGFDDAQEVGRGGFGVVYRCRQRSLRRTVAVKVLTAALDTDGRERFLREQIAMGQLSGHPHIVNIHQVGVTDTGRPFIVMQFHGTGSIDAALRRSGPVEWKQALRYGIKLAGALETAHRREILHRDVKPGNVLLTDYGEPQLTDFGIARVAGGFRTTSGSITGSPAFTAPEILRGAEPDPTADVYGLGATLFCLLTAHAAFERRDGEKLISQFLRMTQQPIPDLREHGFPDDLADTVERAMSLEPADRPATAAALGEELRAVQRRHRLTVDDMAIPASAGENLVHDAPAPITGTSPAPRFTTPPIPVTRSRPPSTHAMVGRERLLDHLRAGLPRRLTVIHGPAGFGKSTLAAQWRDILVSDAVSVAWMTIDHDDNNVAWFLAHLVEAIRQVKPTLAGELGQILEEHGDQAQHYVLATLVNDIYHRSEHLAVVIDDWHRVDDPDTIAALGYLIDNGCHHLRIVVTSRTQAHLPLAKMRVTGELNEIDSASLRFTLDECRAMLVDRAGLQLTDDAVATLRDSTEGWAAALQLASLSLRGRDNPEQLLGSISGRHPAIGEFLAENVLDALDTDVLEFLLQTSVTERLCGSLASALADVGNGQAILEQIESRDLFLQRTDDEGKWFRYHHLFAEFLRKRLERDFPNRVGPLHLVAARWFTAHHLLSEAVDHALAGGDTTGAVRLVEREGFHLLEQGRLTSLLGLVDKLPDHLAATSPRLQLCIAWADSALVRPESAQEAATRAAELLTHHPLPAVELDALRVEADVVQADIKIGIDQIDGVRELLSACLSQPEAVPPWVASAAAGIAGFVTIFDFDFDATRQLQQQSAKYDTQLSGPFSVIYGHCFAGLAEMEELDVVGAERRFRKAHRLAVESGGHRCQAALLAGALLGALLYERGEIAEAEHLLDESQVLGREGGVDFMLAHYVSGARLKSYRGERDTAARYLEAGAQLGASLRLPRLGAAVEYERLVLGLPPLRAPYFTGIEYSNRRYPNNGLEEVVVQLEEAVAIRRLLDTSDSGDVALACSWAQEWVTALVGTRRRRALLQAQRLLATCLSIAGRHDEATGLVAQMVYTCQEQGLVRYLPDGGALMVSLLAAVRDDLTDDRQAWTGIHLSFLESMLET